MNYLAHLYLSGPNQAILLGNFLADFIRKAEDHQYPPEVQRGIELHRRIDYYTDHHPLVVRGTRRLRRAHGHYAPVVIDIFYDYLLSRNWSRFDDRPLAEFSAWAYQALLAQADVLPQRLAQQLRHMVADDWLTGYGDPERLARVFVRLRRRMSRPQLIDGVMDTLERELPALEAEFLGFFPQAIEFVHQILARQR